jgi:predicted negative regulator of RcsB-dependent stress response
MNRYETDDEQVQEIKEWWKKNGSTILISILVVSISWVGWTYYQNQKKAQAVSDSITFQVLQASMAQGQFGNVARDGLKLIEQHPNSPYAVGSAFLLAKFYLSKGETSNAIEQLNWVANQSNEASLKLVANVRLAKILFSEGKAVKAKAALKNASLLPLESSEKSTLDYAYADYYLSVLDDKQARVYLEKVIQNKSANSDLSHLAVLQLKDLAQSSKYFMEKFPSMILRPKIVYMLMIMLSVFILSSCSAPKKVRIPMPVSTLPSPYDLQRIWQLTLNDFDYSDGVGLSFAQDANRYYFA